MTSIVPKTLSTNTYLFYLRIHHLVGGHSWDITFPSPLD